MQVDATSSDMHKMYACLARRVGSSTFTGQLFGIRDRPDSAVFPYSHLFARFSLP